ncbi:hypothetical protein ANCCAN_21380 [Ancylostoma caninum]|uniref:Uncharacterized protein n=1 Tax=Ancylostoma caninum TaxID=29170 RepID=A0A368FP58_ANCCA|nr:hypothetical protein ANCCAN_21380 [Ancylostoma caninum]
MDENGGVNLNTIAKRRFRAVAASCFRWKIGILYGRTTISTCYKAATATAAATTEEPTSQTLLSHISRLYGSS